MAVASAGMNTSPSYVTPDDDAIFLAPGETHTQKPKPIHPRYVGCNKMFNDKSTFSCFYSSKTVQQVKHPASDK